MNEAPTLPLNFREREVCRLVAQSYSNRDIAAELGVSVGTVKLDIVNAMAKVGAVDRIGLAVFFTRQTLLAKWTTSGGNPCDNRPRQTS